jgi:hypothetical protein
MPRFELDDDGVVVMSGSWTVKEDCPTLPSWTCQAVGGTTVHWTGATPRIRAVAGCADRPVSRYIQLRLRAASEGGVARARIRGWMAPRMQSCPGTW